MKGRRNRLIAGAALVVLVLAALLLVGTLMAGLRQDGGNLALQKGVRASSDSAENEDLTADKAIDGDDQDRLSRWSSANDWENAHHYIELEFPEEISVSFVVLKWERRNAVSYALEGSVDGVTYRTLQSFDTAPSADTQEIVLGQPEQVRFLRLSVSEVSQTQEDYSNLYQNVSLYEFEAYEEKPATYRMEAPTIETAADGSRRLVMPQAPEGCEVAWIGAEYEQIIGADGTVYDTIQDKEVTVGFRVTDKEDGEVRERSFTIMVPAKQTQNAAEPNEQPEVIPALAEWAGGSGNYVWNRESRVLLDVPKEYADAARKLAELLLDELGDAQTCPAHQIMEGSAEDAAAGDLVLCIADTGNGLGEEGYTMTITDKCVISAEALQGLRWGTVTFHQLLDLYGEDIPQGEVRDYPKYEVRGFGIDVARKAVSLDTLYAMLETMSYYKMNDFAIHLNDNAILATSGIGDSMDEAFEVQSAFRLESELTGEQGEPLTSEEYAYTKEELNALIETAELYGVRVVPEIDTPAHSLSITKLYPQYALGENPLWADQLNLDSEDVRGLVRNLWQEELHAQTGAFRNAETVNIGMDEYYGDGRVYRRYLNEIRELVQTEGRQVRLWGSLSNIEGTEMPPAENLQMNIWSTVWADPAEMYEAGYSLIDMQNNHLYIIPGGGYDYLDTEELWRNWEPGKFYDHSFLETIPSYSMQLLGAAYMIWNDMNGSLDLGLCEYDLYDRFEAPLPVMSQKLWGETTEGEQTAVRQAKPYEAEQGIVPAYDVQCRVMLEDTQTEQILAKSDAAYGTWAFYAALPGSGKVGFCREGKTYSFDYTIPAGQWVELRIVGEKGRTTLYADGEKVGTLGSQEAFEEYATFVFPIQYLGEETGSFRGEVEWMALRGGERETDGLHDGKEE